MITDRLKRIEEESDRLHKQAYPDQYGEQKKEEVVVEKAPVAKESEFTAEDYKRKYEILQGKYNAEVPRLHLELAKLKEKAETLAAQGSSGSNEETETFTSEEVELLKEEYPDIYNGVQAMLKGKIKETPLQTKRQEQANPWTEAEREYLSTVAPKWKELNTNKDFLDWLGHKDRYARKTRQELLSEAYVNHEVETVANFFNDYAQFVLNPQKSDDEVEVAPQSTSSGIKTNKDNRQIISRSEVHKFYTDVAAGKYHGKEDEMRRQEALINQAVAEGRVR